MKAIIIGILTLAFVLSGCTSNPCQSVQEQKNKLFAEKEALKKEISERDKVLRALGISKKDLSQIAKVNKTSTFNMDSLIVECMSVNNKLSSLYSKEIKALGKSCDENSFEFYGIGLKASSSK